MTEAVFQFKAINRVLNRQEQKADFEAKNPKVEQSVYDSLSGGMFGIGAPLVQPDYSELFERIKEYRDANPIAPLKSLAHPNWPYTGTGFEWSKFVKVKI